MSPAASDIGGFLLVTVDPDVSGGGTGRARDLIDARLESGVWPLYERTPNRSRISAGSKVAFYVGGKRDGSRRIVATAVIAETKRYRPGAPRPDPPEFLTETPDVLLLLEQIKVLKDPVVLRDVLPQLSICPKNMKTWGCILMGGVRAIPRADWKILFGRT